MLLRNPGGVIGLVILAIAIAVAVFGPMLFPTSPWRMVQRPFLPPFTLKGVPLGTDALGRDVLAGIIYGARVSLLVGLVSTLAALAVGIPVGAMAGYFGGRIGDALMRFTEFFSNRPELRAGDRAGCGAATVDRLNRHCDRHRQLAAGGAARARRGPIITNPRICSGGDRDRANP